MVPWNPRANELLLEALEHPPGPARDAFLDGACPGDAELRAQVDSLLTGCEQACDFLSSPAEELLQSAFEVAPPEQIGAMVGAYKLLQEIGDGGMGVVYMAEQSQPMRRMVALKIVKPGMDSRQVAARFEAERQALALMEHPNIARVIDAGTTDSGRPYFVMELVKGVPITNYCDAHRLTPRERLELFLPVCKAMQHAHQKGIIHRDLKPSNVLVALYDGLPVPKVIDFGVAKATAQRLTERTLFTEFGAVIGTVDYMSPEQAELNQLDVDTRSDIYSLGVLLYELLTGATPLACQRTTKSSVIDLLRLVRESEPLRPSTQLSSVNELATLAVNRGAEPKKLSRLVRGELDWVVMKALEKDRSRRYQTVGDLARDIERYLNHCGVEARPPSALYRFQKFARRNRLMLTAVILVSATLIIGAVISAALAIRATRAMQLAEAARADEAIHRKSAEQRRLDADQARAAEAVQRKIAEEGRNAAELRRAQMEAAFRDSRDAIDAYFTSLKANERLNVPALQPLRKELLGSALASYRQFVDQHGDDSALEAELANAYVRIGVLSRAIGSKQQAINALQQGVQRYERLAQNHPEHWWDVAIAYEQLGNQQQVAGQLVEAKESLTRALANWQKSAQLHPHDSDYQINASRAHVQLGNLQRLLEQFVEAEASFRHAFEIYEKLESDAPLQSEYRMHLAEAHYFLGALQHMTGRSADAEASFRLSIQINERLASEDQAEPSYLAGIAGAAYQLGHVQRLTDRLDAAQASYARALELYGKLGLKDPSNATYRRSVGGARFHLGLLEWVAGRQEDAIQSWNAALAEFDAAAELGYESAGFFAGRAEALAMLGRWREAADALAKAVDYGDFNWRLSCQLALLHWAGGDGKRHRAACKELVTSRAELATASEASAIVLACLVNPKAVDDWNAVLALAERAAAADPSDPVYQTLVGAAQYRAGQFEPAQRSLEQSLPLLNAADSPAPPRLNAVRSSRLLGEVMLMLVCRERGDEAGAARQSRTVQDLVDKMQSTAPLYCDEGESWRIAFAVLFAHRELARVEAPIER